MGGGGGGKGGGGGYTEGPAAKQMADISKMLVTEAGPFRREFETQGLSALQQGGVGTNIPLVQNAVESSKKSLSDTLKGIKDSLASSGLAGTPFMENILAGSKISGEQGVNQTASNTAMWLLNSMPAFILGAQGQGIQAGGQAVQGENAAMQANAASNAAKGNQMASMFSAMFPKISYAM